ncbi:unnamed protein product [Urochloa humidicola]
MSWLGAGEVGGAREERGLLEHWLARGRAATGSGDLLGRSDGGGGRYWRRSGIRRRRPAWAAQRDPATAGTRSSSGGLRRRLVSALSLSLPGDGKAVAGRRALDPSGLVGSSARATAGRGHARHGLSS